MSVYIKHDVNTAEKRLLQQSVLAQSLMWEAANNKKIRPVNIYIFRENSIPCGKRKGRFSGAFFLGEQDIHVTMGDRYSIPSLYHELYHHELYYSPLNADTEHRDKRWKIWKQDQRAIVQHIRKQRANLNWYEIYWSKE